MNRSIPPRKIGIVLVTLALSGALAPATVRAQSLSPAPGASTVFPAEAEKAFAEFVAKAREAKSFSLSKRMSKEVESVSKATALSQEGVAALEAAGKAAAEASAKDWANKLDIMFRQQYGRYAGNLSESFAQMTSNAEHYAELDIIHDYLLPFEDLAWTRSLSTTLTAEQAVMWTKAEAARRHVIAVKAGDFLKRRLEGLRTTYTQQLEGRVATIKSSLSLSPERVLELDQLVKDTVEKGCEAVGNQIQKNLYGAGEEQLRLILLGRQTYVFGPSGQPLDRQPAWQDGLKALLTAADWSELEKAKQLHAERREQAMAVLMLVEFDQRVGLSASQRQQLEPVCERLIKADAGAFSREPDDAPNPVRPEVFLAAGAKAGAGEMQQILDPTQWKRWQEACTPAPAALSSTRAVEEPPASKPGPFDPEEWERMVSDFLFEKANQERQRFLALQLLKVEDVARIAKLDAAVVAQLQSAARGATEENLGPWKATFGQMVRSQLRDLNPQTLKERLASMRAPSQSSRVVYRELETNPAEPRSLWDQAVQSRLSDAQRTVWQQELEARKEFKKGVVIAVILTELDRFTRISAAQWEALRPLVGAVVTEYAPEFAEMFNSNVPWYFQGSLVFAPLAGIPEEKFQAVLGKESWERFTGCKQFSTSKNNWENLQRRHSQRLKAKD